MKFLGLGLRNSKKNKDLATVPQSEQTAKQRPSAKKETGKSSSKLKNGNIRGRYLESWREDVASASASRRQRSRSRSRSLSRPRSRRTIHETRTQSYGGGSLSGRSKHQSTDAASIATSANTSKSNHSKVTRATKSSQASGRKSRSSSRSRSRRRSRSRSRGRTYHRPTSVGSQSSSTRKPGKRKSSKNSNHKPKSISSVFSKSSRSTQSKMNRSTHSRAKKNQNTATQPSATLQNSEGVVEQESSNSKTKNAIGNADYLLRRPPTPKFQEKLPQEDIHDTFPQPIPSTKSPTPTSDHTPSAFSNWACDPVQFHRQASVPQESKSLRQPLQTSSVEEAPTLNAPSKGVQVGGKVRQRNQDGLNRTTDESRDYQICSTFEAITAAPYICIEAFCGGDDWSTEDGSQCRTPRKRTFSNATTDRKQAAIATSMPRPDKLVEELQKYKAPPSISKNAIRRQEVPIPVGRTGPPNSIKVLDGTEEKPRVNNRLISKRTSSSESSNTSSVARSWIYDGEESDEDDGDVSTEMGEEEEMPDNAMESREDEPKTRIIQRLSESTNEREGKDLVPTLKRECSNSKAESSSQLVPVDDETANQLRSQLLQQGQVDRQLLLKLLKETEGVDLSSQTSSRRSRDRSERQSIQGSKTGGGAKLHRKSANSTGRSSLDGKVLRLKTGPHYSHTGSSTGAISMQTHLEEPSMSDEEQEDPVAICDDASSLTPECSAATKELEEWEAMEGRLKALLNAVSSDGGEEKHLQETYSM